jgi:N-acetylglutamate synthase-like GNAT family acetyltransferase
MASEILPEGYAISTDAALLDIDVIHGFITRSYWAKAIPRTLIEQMIRRSLCFGVYHRGAQAGFARVISDYTTFGYLADVFILPEHRGQGLSKVLVATVMAHPELQGLRRWMLVTADAQSLYAPFGFKPVAQPERYMEIHRPGLYQQGPGD